MDSYSYHLEEKGSDPFPVQRINWIKRIYPMAEVVFKKAKATSEKQEYYLDKLAKMYEVYDIIEEEYIRLLYSLIK